VFFRIVDHVDQHGLVELLDLFGHGIGHRFGVRWPHRAALISYMKTASRALVKLVWMRSTTQMATLRKMTSTSQLPADPLQK